MTDTDLVTRDDTLTADTAVSVADMFAVDSLKRDALAKDADATAQTLAQVDPASPDFEDVIDHIREVGRDEVSQSSDALEELLSRRVIPDSGNTPAIDSANAQLGDLRDAVVDLDPTGTPRTMRGKFNRALSGLPGGKGLRKMLSGYESAGTQIKGIAKALDDTSDTLNNDITLARTEMHRLWDDLAVLGEQDATFGELDRAMRRTADELRAKGDQRRADALEGQALVAVGMRRQDVATHAAVVLNAYMTLKVLTDTGKKLAEGVYYAKNTSLTALRLVSAGDVVAGAQGAAADQLEATREMTGALMEKSSEKLAQQTIRVNEQAHKTAVGVDKIQKSFQNTYGAIETATKAGIEANAKIQEQIDALNRGLAEFRGKTIDQQAIGGGRA